MEIVGDVVGLSDEELLENLAASVAERGRLTARLVAHVAEVDRRRLYAHSAYSSMFDYCVRKLGLSEGTAYRHITAARKSRVGRAATTRLRRVTKGRMSG